MLLELRKEHGATSFKERGNFKITMATQVKVYYHLGVKRLLEKKININFKN